MRGGASMDDVCEGCGASSPDRERHQLSDVVFCMSLYVHFRIAAGTCVYVPSWVGTAVSRTQARKRVFSPSLISTVHIPGTQWKNPCLFLRHIIPRR